MTSKSAVIENIWDQTSAQDMLLDETIETAVDMTLWAVVAYIEANKAHFEMTSPGSAVALDVLVAEMKRDFEIHD